MQSATIHMRKLRLAKPYEKPVSVAALTRSAKSIAGAQMSIQWVKATSQGTSSEL